MGLVRSLIVSFERIALGFGLAAIVALPLGVLMAAFNRIAAFFKPVAVVSGYVPIVVFIPLSLAWFGIGETQKVGFLFIGCFVALLPAVIHAINSVPNDYINVVATKGANQWQIVTQVLVPVAGPSIWQSLRVVYGVGWGWIILAEIVNGDAGLGYLINLSERRGLTSNIYAIILIIVAVAVVCDKLWVIAGHRLFPYVTAETTEPAPKPGPRRAGRRKARGHPANPIADGHSDQGDRGRSAACRRIPACNQELQRQGHGGRH